MEWKERAVHGFCFADRPKSCSRKEFPPATKEYIVQQPMRSREQAGESLELGSFPAPPARHSGTRSAPPFQSLTSHSTILDSTHWLVSTPPQAVPLCRPRDALPQPSSTATSPPKVFLRLFTPWSTLTSCLVTYLKVNNLNCIPTDEIKWVDLLGSRSEGHPTALAFLQHQAESGPLTRQVLLLPALFICFCHVNIFKYSPQNNCKCHKTHFNGWQRSRQDLGPTGIIRAMQTKTG